MTDENVADPARAPEPPATVSGRKAPVPKKKRPGKYRMPPREQRHGLLIVNTGDGKGKTTAALGTVTRAWGRGLRCVIFQFIKSAENPYGEHMACGKMAIEIEPLGDGFTWLSDDLEADRALAAEGWARCQSAIESGVYDVLVFDELTYPLNFGWLDQAMVLSAIAARPKGTHIIVTGRNAPDALIEAADMVTDMRVVKHPYRDQGLGAQAGIDL
jgi:cob(I)alamin adenosyltransferase